MREKVELVEGGNGTGYRNYAHSRTLNRYYWSSPNLLIPEEKAFTARWEGINASWDSFTLRLFSDSVKREKASLRRNMRNETREEVLQVMYT